MTGVCHSDVDHARSQQTKHLSLKTSDAVLISPLGEVACGHKEIHNLLAKYLGGPAKGSKHTGRINRINFVTDNVAVVDGEALIQGSEFDELPTWAHHRFTDILVRSGDVWLRFPGCCVSRSTIQQHRKILLALKKRSYW